MTADEATPSARQIELLEAAYRYVLTHGLAEMSLRPLAVAVGSSPRVLLYLFGSKDGLVRALVARARAEELAVLDRLHDAATAQPLGLGAAVTEIWNWLAAKQHRPLLNLWVEAYGRSLMEPDGAWAGFARATVDDWMGLLAKCQPADQRTTADGAVQRTLALAILRGALLDLLATGDTERLTSAVHHQAAMF